MNTAARLPRGLTAQIVVDLLEKGVAGIVHVAGSGRFSRYEIAQILAKRYPELPALIRPGSLKEYTGAPRSPDTSLDISATEEFLGRKIPALDTWLQENPGEPF